MTDLLAFEQKVKTISNAELLQHMTHLFQREKKIGDAILLGLKEIKHRRLFAEMGYSSLFEFLNKYFKLSETGCYQRIQCLKLIESASEVQDSLFKGEVTLANLASAQTLITQIEKATEKPVTPEQKKELVEAIKNKTNKEAKAALLNSPLATQNPAATLPVTKVKPLIQNHIQLQLTLDSAAMSQLKEIRDLLGHTIPSGDYSEIVKYLAAQMVDVLRKKKGRLPTEIKVSNLASESSSNVPLNLPEITPSNITSSKSASAIRPSRAIPQEIKRKVFERAGERCEFVGANGHRCNSRFQLEVDHIVPWSQGGDHNPDSLQVLCKQHNQFRVKETHGFFFTK